MQSGTLKQGSLPRDSQQPGGSRGHGQHARQLCGGSGRPSRQVLLLSSALGLPAKPCSCASHIQRGRQKTPTLLSLMSITDRRTIKKVSTKRMNGAVPRRPSASISVLSSPGISVVKRQYWTETEFWRGSFSPKKELQFWFIKWVAGEAHTHEKRHFCVYILEQRKGRRI